MTILFDTNVVLDVLLDRTPYAESAARLFGHVERGGLAGMLTSTTVTTVYYVGRKEVGDGVARAGIQRLLDLFAMAPVYRSALQAALDSGFHDFEDAVLHEAARQARADGIVTRNADDFTAATLTIYTPAELLQALRPS